STTTTGWTSTTSPASAKTRRSRQARTPTPCSCSTRKTARGRRCACRIRSASTTAAWTAVSTIPKRAGRAARCTRTTARTSSGTPRAARAPSASSSSFRSGQTRSRAERGGPHVLRIVRALETLERPDHVHVRRARRHHRQHLLARLDAGVHETRPAFRERRFERVARRDRRVEVERLDAESARERDEIRRLAIRRGERALAVEERLLLEHEAERAVVHDEDLDVQVFLGERRELLRVHEYRAVARDAEHGGLGRSKRR